MRRVGRSGLDDAEMRDVAGQIEHVLALVSVRPRQRLGRGGIWVLDRRQVGAGADDAGMVVRRLLERFERAFDVDLVARGHQVQRVADVREGELRPADMDARTGELDRAMHVARAVEARAELRQRRRRRERGGGVVPDQRYPLAGAVGPDLPHDRRGLRHPHLGQDVDEAQAAVEVDDLELDRHLRVLEARTPQPEHQVLGKVTLVVHAVGRVEERAVEVGLAGHHADLVVGVRHQHQRVLGALAQECRVQRDRIPCVRDDRSLRQRRLRDRVLEVGHARLDRAQGDMDVLVPPFRRDENVDLRTPHIVGDEEALRDQRAVDRVVDRLRVHERLFPGVEPIIVVAHHLVRRVHVVGPVHVGLRHDRPGLIVEQVRRRRFAVADVPHPAVRADIPTAAVAQARAAHVALLHLDGLEAVLRDAEVGRRSIVVGGGDLQNVAELRQQQPIRERRIGIVGREQRNLELIGVGVGEAQPFLHQRVVAEQQVVLPIALGAREVEVGIIVARRGRVAQALLDPREVLRDALQRPVGAELIDQTLERRDIRRQRRDLRADERFELLQIVGAQIELVGRCDLVRLDHLDRNDLRGIDLDIGNRDMADGYSRLLGIGAFDPLRPIEHGLPRARRRHRSRLGGSRIHIDDEIAFFNIGFDVRWRCGQQQEARIGGRQIDHHRLRGGGVKCVHHAKHIVHSPGRDLDLGLARLHHREASEQPGIVIDRIERDVIERALRVVLQVVVILGLLLLIVAEDDPTFHGGISVLEAAADDEAIDAGDEWTPGDEARHRPEFEQHAINQFLGCHRRSASASHRCRVMRQVEASIDRNATEHAPLVDRAEPYPDPSGVFRETVAADAHELHRAAPLHLA